MGLKSDAVIGVVGAGAMGAGIAQVAAAAGHDVLLYDAHPGAAELGKARTADALARLIEKGRMAADESDELLDRIKICHDLAEFAPVSLVIEAIVEDREAKREVFTRLDEITPGALLTSNTSSLSITELGSCLKDPSRFAGLHFFNPAAVMPLVEVVRGLRTSDETIQTLVETATAWGKTPVVAKNAPGFIVNKGARPFYGEALRFLEEGGADAATIDSLMRAAGFKMGPFELIDLIGLDINLAVSRQMWQAYYGEPRYQPSMLVEEMVAAGYLGRKSGRGFYDYSGEGKPEPKVMPPCKPPAAITVHGSLGPASILAKLWADAGIGVDLRPVPEQRAAFAGCIRAEGLSLVISPDDATGDTVTFDLSPDYQRCEQLAIAGESEPSVELAAGLFQALGKKVSRVSNLQVLPVARTVSMLVNEAADTLGRGIASAPEIDKAMQLGLSYPFGPLQFFEDFGPHHIYRCLLALEAEYGQRYRTSAVLLERYRHSEGYGVD